MRLNTARDPGLATITNQRKVKGNTTASMRLNTARDPGLATITNQRKVKGNTTASTRLKQQGVLVWRLSQIKEK